MPQSISPAQILTEHLGTEYANLQMKTGNFNMTMAGSADSDSVHDTGVAKFPNGLLYWQIFPQTPQNSWQFFMRGSTMTQGATNLSVSMHVVNVNTNTNTVSIHWVAWGY